MINKVGIIGEGKMGSGIFFYLLGYSFDLVWVCSAVADREKLTRQFEKRIRRSLDAGILDQAKYDKLLTTPITTDAVVLHDCDLVIEAIPEDLAAKKNLFKRLDNIINPGAIFTTNSSSINPSVIMPDAAGGRQFAGLHFFYPVALKDIAEVTLAPSTTAQTRLALESFLNTIQRRFITLDEHNSFILNKIFLDFQNEAYLMVHEGVCSFFQMDQLVKKHFFEFGVFDFCDGVGLDTMLASIRNYTRDYLDKTHYDLFLSALADLVAARKLGVKSHEGFYQYPMGEMTAEVPGHALEIVRKLHQTWLSSCKNFTECSSVPHDLMNHAIKEYFGIVQGPLE